MSDENPSNISTGQMTGEEEGRPADKYRNGLDEVKREFGDTVKEVQEHFRVLLELRDDRIAVLDQELAKAQQQRANARVLLIDDAESTVEITDRHLEEYPIDVVGVGGSQAADHLRSESYDAIMIEATSSIKPGVDGMGLFQELCESGKGRSVVVMSSRPGEKIRHAVERAGGAFLRKPFEREQLVGLVSQIVLREKE